MQQQIERLRKLAAILKDLPTFDDLPAWQRYAIADDVRKTANAIETEFNKAAWNYLLGDHDDS